MKMFWADQTLFELPVFLFVLYETVDMSLAADVTFTCPQLWDVGHKGPGGDQTLVSTRSILLTCAVIKRSISEKCIGSAPKVTSFYLLRGAGGVDKDDDGRIVCTVTAEQYDTCSFVPDGRVSGCGCVQNSTHYVFVLQIVPGADAPVEVYEGSWTCIKSCSSSTRGGFGANPLTLNVSPFCTNVKFRVCQGKTCSNSEKLNLTTCQCECQIPWGGQTCTTGATEVTPSGSTRATLLFVGVSAAALTLGILAVVLKRFWKGHARKKKAVDPASTNQTAVNTFNTSKTTPTTTTNSNNITRLIPSSVSYDAPSTKTSTTAESASDMTASPYLVSSDPDSWHVKEVLVQSAAALETKK